MLGNNYKGNNKYIIKNSIFIKTEHLTCRNFSLFSWPQQLNQFTSLKLSPTIDKRPSAASLIIRRTMTSVSTIPRFPSRRKRYAQSPLPVHCSHIHTRGGAAQMDFHLSPRRGRKALASRRAALLTIINFDRPCRGCRDLIPTYLSCTLPSF